MLVIKKGKSKMKVAKSAYNNFYKGAGWEIDDEVSAVVYSSESDKKIEDNNSNNEDDEWEDYVDEEETMEKDLSEMSHSELKEKAESLGIDTTGMNTKQLRAKLKSLS